jgi:hypothetical protein
LIYHSDLASTGVNPNETVLTPSNVNASDFGKLFQIPLDGMPYAQPLVETGVNITVGPYPRVHDVVFVATEHDSVYAIDAENPNGEILWQRSLLDTHLPGATNVTPIPPADTNNLDDTPIEIGITGTPVIDSNTGTLYVVSRQKEYVNNVAHYVYWLSALNIASRTDAVAPAMIDDTTYTALSTYKNNMSTYVYSNGTASVIDPYNGTGESVVQFNALRGHQRTALALVNSVLYVAMGSYGDPPSYHGWVIAYNPATLGLEGIFCDTPNGSQGGIWESGGAITSDGTYLYIETGNGTFDGSNGNSGNTATSGTVTGLDTNGFPIHGDYGDSFLKLAVDPTTSPTHQNVNGWGLKVVDYFTPFN